MKLLTQCDRCGGRFVSKDCFPIVDEIMVCVSCRQAMRLQAELSANEQAYAKADNLLIERNRELAEVRTEIERLKSVLPQLEMESTQRTLTVAKLEAEVGNNKLWFNEYQRIEDSLIDLIEVTDLVDGTNNVISAIEKLKSLFGEILGEIVDSPMTSYLHSRKIKEIFTSKLKEAGIELEKTK